MQGFRDEMEDAYSINIKAQFTPDNHTGRSNLKLNLKEFPEPLSNWSFFAVFDGHGGPQTAWTASSRLFHHITQHANIKILKNSSEYETESISTAIE